MYDCGGPIFIRLGNRGRTYDKSIKQIYSTDVKPEGRPVGKIRNIQIRNIEGRLTGRIDPPTEGIMFTGLPNHYIEDVVLENIHYSYTGFGNLDVKDREIPEDEARYPEQLFFGPLPSYGMYFRHVKGLKLNNITMELRNHDNRSAIVMDDVIESSLENVNVDIYSEAGSVVILRNAKDIELSNLNPSGETEYLIDVKGEQSENIRLIKTDLKVIQINKVAVFSDHANNKSVFIKNE